MSIQLMPSKALSSDELPSSVLHEQDLGEHLLVIHQDKSIELIDLCDEARSGACHGLVLTGEEAYYLFISLKEVF